MLNNFFSIADVLRKPLISSKNFDNQRNTKRTPRNDVHSNADQNQDPKRKENAPSHQPRFGQNKDQNSKWQTREATNQPDIKQINSSQKKSDNAPGNQSLNQCQVGRQLSPYIQI